MSHLTVEDIAAGQSPTGHPNRAIPHVLPGMQADAARTYQRLAAPAPPAHPTTGGSSEEQPDDHRRPVRAVWN
jgi:hypothetical protein